MQKRRLCGFAFLLLAASQASCAEVVKSAQKTWHQKFNWNAEDFFDDPKVIALCQAIEADDLKEIDRLVADGADVNAQGKGKMTPLLWAFPDNKPERFKKLLELGADPNVIVESDFNTRMSGILPGDSVTHMACDTWFPRYFDLVFEHGGDPNLWNRRKHSMPLHLVIFGPAQEKPRKVKRLLELGADIDANIDNEYTGGRTPVKQAVLSRQYDVALLLLEAGADYTTYYPPHLDSKLIHTVVAHERSLPHISEQGRENHRKLLQWLEKHGESAEAARKDRARTLASPSYERKAE